jgi:hypothetical protein
MAATGRNTAALDEFRWAANDPTGPIAVKKYTAGGGLVITADQRRAVLELAAATGVSAYPRTRWGLQIASGGMGTFDVVTDVIPARQVAVAYAQMLTAWDQGLRDGEDVLGAALGRLAVARSLGQLSRIELEAAERKILRTAFGDITRRDIIGSPNEYGDDLTPSGPLEETLTALLTEFTDIPYGAAGAGLHAATLTALGMLHLTDTARALCGLPVDVPAGARTGGRSGAWTTVTPRTRAGQSGGNSIVS